MNFPKFIKKSRLYKFPERSCLNCHIPVRDGNCKYIAYADNAEHLDAGKCGCLRWRKAD